MHLCFLHISLLRSAKHPLRLLLSPDVHNCQLTLSLVLTLSQVENVNRFLKEVWIQKNQDPRKKRLKKAIDKVKCSCSLDFISDAHLKVNSRKRRWEKSDRVKRYFKNMTPYFNGFALHVIIFVITHTHTHFKTPSAYVYQL